MSQKIAVIAAQWNANIVNKAVETFTAEIGSDADVDVFAAPGSLEIPFMGKKLLEQGYDIAVGIGFIVNGGIYRHEFVGQAVVDGIVNASLQTGKPFLSVALTPQAYNEHSAENEAFFVEHMVTKGKEAAHACKKMLSFAADAHSLKKAA